MSDPIRQLGELSYFHGQPPEALARLVRASEEFTYEPGEWLSREGAIATAPIILLAGVAESTTKVAGDTGAPRVLTPGAIIGAGATFTDDLPHSASVMARVPCDTLILNPAWLTKRTDDTVVAAFETAVAWELAQNLRRLNLRRDRAAAADRPLDTPNKQTLFSRLRTALGG